MRNLETVPPRSVDYQGVRFEELDIDAVVATRPDVVLIDELAHTHVDRARKRWEDAAELLRVGISVITTVNVAHLLSLRDYAAGVTGTGLVESVPDEFVRAGEVVLIDLDPETLRRRIAAGRVYSADAVGGALGNYFRVHPPSPRSASSDRPGSPGRSMRWLRPCSPVWARTRSSRAT